MRGSTLACSAAAFMMCASATASRAWGPEGHTVIARAAMTQFSSQALADWQWIVSVGVPALNAQIPGGKCQIDPANPLGPVPDYHIDLDQHTNLANWPDCFRTLDETTAPWHFDDIPLGDSPTGPLNVSQQTWCATGCVSSALADNLRKLATPGLAPADAARALAYVVHFVGDMHQPLHAEDDKDRGGNDVLILTDGSGASATNLHALWDVPLVEVALGTDLDAATAQVSSAIAGGHGGWIAGADTVEGAISASDGWAEDAHLLAQPAYSMLNIAVGTGPAKNVAITSAYVQTESSVVVSGQIDRAALRLSAVLNAALTWTPPPPSGSSASGR